MSFPKYYVTYCTMDTDAGANPFGHSSLIFSQQKKEKAPVEVLDSIGYYSQPSTTANPFLRGFKQVLGFTVDLQDGHGILKQEGMRYLDGKGLHGISFEVSQEQFVAIKKNYQQMMKSEQEVIEELNIELLNQGKEANGYTRYIAEQEKAKAEGRPSRLKPFHFTMKLTMNGLDSSDSYTCKDHSLELLTNHKIITEDIRNQIISNRATTAFPRFSSIYLPPIRLISTGEPAEKVTSKKTGEVFYNRVWKKNSLFWASPLYTPEQTIKDDSEIDKNYFLLESMLERIRSVEHSLHQGMSRLEKEGMAQSPQWLELNTQLYRVYKVSLLFANAHINQSSDDLEKNLALADKILNVANLSLNPAQLNYSFLLKAYNSLTFFDALLGLLVMAVAAATIMVNPIVGIGLLATSTTYTINRLYRFYKEEVEFSKTSQDYESYATVPQKEQEFEAVVQALS